VDPRHSADGPPRKRRRTAARAAGQAGKAPASKRSPDYRNLRSPFVPMSVFSDDEALAMHETALRTLQELGLRVLLPEAIALFAAGGARVQGDMVYIGREMIEAALASAPKSITGRAGARARDITLELGRLVFQQGAGAPHATDLVRGRRTGSAADFRDYTMLGHHFDVFQMMSPSVEPQDVPVHLRHYFTTEVQMTLTDKFPFVFSRGTPQVRECFEMIQTFRGLSDAEFAAHPQCYTIINTSHAEALAAITLTQLVRAGAPVCYGTFTSNVDMKSGAPAFGTPARRRPTKTRWGCGAV